MFVIRNSLEDFSLAFHPTISGVRSTFYSLPLLSRYTFLHSLIETLKVLKWCTHSQAWDEDYNQGQEILLEKEGLATLPAEIQQSIFEAAFLDIPIQIELVQPPRTFHTVGARLLIAFTCRTLHNNFKKWYISWRRQKNLVNTTKFGPLFLDRTSFTFTVDNRLHGDELCPTYPKESRTLRRVTLRACEIPTCPSLVPSYFHGWTDIDLSPIRCLKLIFLGEEFVGHPGPRYEYHNTAALSRIWKWHRVKELDVYVHWPITREIKKRWESREYLDEHCLLHAFLWRMRDFPVNRCPGTRLGWKRERWKG